MSREGLPYRHVRLTFFRLIDPQSLTIRHRVISFYRAENETFMIDLEAFCFLPAKTLVSQILSDI